MFDFGGHVVVVTGAGAGIGFGIAHAFHDAGARVALADFREPALQRSLARLGTTDRVFGQVVDVRRAEDVRRFLDGAERALGSITVAVANAGIYPNTPVLEMAEEEWDRVIDTNLRGVFLTCQAAARRMVAQNIPGKIITISSGAYRSGRPGAAHYCASKAGVVMFTKVLALELAKHRINVNCIAPGFIRVEGEVSPLSEEYVSTLTRQIPWGRAGIPQDIANGALFLVSPLAEYMTGEVLAINGGTSAGRAYLPLSTPKRP